MQQTTTTELFTVKLNSSVHFRPLFVRQQETTEDIWIVGHEPSDTTVALPTAGIIAIQKLQEGASVSEVREAVLQQCNEDIDIADLVQTLAGFGLVESIDEQLMEKPRSIGQAWLDHIPISCVSWLYSSVALCFYGIIIIIGLLLFIYDPET